jgi:hypothetical protein
MSPPETATISKPHPARYQLTAIEPSGEFGY